MQEIASITWDSLYGELVSFVHTKVKDKPTAEDIVQDVFIKVHTRGSQLKETEKIANWIYQITRNAVADHFRKAARNIKPVNVDWESSYHEFNDCVAHCLQVLMNTMPDKYQVPLRLAEVDNLTQYEIAEKLNISHSGARSRVQRARKMLKDKLDELYYIKTDSYGNVISCEDRLPCCCTKKC
ncbi:MAG TPA: sigma-70 family RNA polymerase sigma factor [Ohtaekwangia sp.]